MEKKKIVFLYTEIASYFLACVEKLALRPDIEISVVRWPVNKEAPFEFKFSGNVNFIERNKFTDKQLFDTVNNINPSVIVCSGWMDKGYLRICKKFKNRAKTILTIDNQWVGTIKQFIACVASPFYLKSRFSYCWVPGELQKKYALKLGFKNEHILTGFYSCDFDFFYSQYLRNKSEKLKQFPKKFIYVGRYVENKGIENLWRAFIELHTELPNDWELWCLGTGKIEPIEHPKIKHFGFVQPSSLDSYLKNTGVFVLPSFFEPWGVVVHEFASAGFPVICSNEVGARTAFVENDFNGYLYDFKNVNALKDALKQMVLSDDSLLNKMAERSVFKSTCITPETWVKQITSLI
jgi:glycosyltransferase involved in cell wall biosynthesis